MSLRGVSDSFGLFMPCPTAEAAVTTLEQEVAACVDAERLLLELLPAIEEAARRRDVHDRVLPQYLARLDEQVLGGKAFAKAKTAMFEFMRTSGTTIAKTCLLSAAHVAASQQFQV